MSRHFGMTSTARWSNGCMRIRSPEICRMTIEQTQLSIGAYTYDVRRAGDGDALVILLHGFPETSHMWLPLLEHLAANGYTALAPDLRISSCSLFAMLRPPSGALASRLIRPQRENRQVRCGVSLRASAPQCASQASRVRSIASQDHRSPIGVSVGCGISRPAGVRSLRTGVDTWSFG